MKKNLILWSVGMIALIFSACQKSEVSDLSSVNDQPASAAGKRSPQQAVVTYGGYATGINATITSEMNGGIVSNQTLLSNTGLLPGVGGTLTASDAQASIPGVLTVETLNASTAGAGSQTISQASATGLSITVSGNVITADNLSSSATATCGAVSGSSQITNLTVNGVPVEVTGAPNQTIYLSAGSFIIINEQSSSKKGKTSNMNVTALHILIPGSADIRVAATRAEIKC